MWNLSKFAPLARPDESGSLKGAAFAVAPHLTMKKFWKYASCGPSKLIPSPSHECTYKSVMKDSNPLGVRNGDDVDHLVVIPVPRPLRITRLLKVYRRP